MPGITMIGDSRNGNRHRPTSLPAEARSTCRMLRLLKDPKVSSEALVDSLHDKGIQTELKQTLKEMGKHGWDHFSVGQAENRMSLALHFCLTKAMKEAKTRSTSTTMTIEKKNEDHGINTNTEILKTAAASAAVVSESSGVSSAGEEEEELSRVATTEITTTLPRSQVMKNFWSRVLESLHLQVASRTTRVWGKKKIYEIYELCSPAKQVVTQINQVCKNVEKEFRAIFHGGGEDQSGCRVYALLKDSLLYIQINIGKPYDLQDESNRAQSGEKKKKKPNEYVALVEPGSSLVALTASRAPSAKTCRFTKYVLTALEAALATTAVARPSNRLDESFVPQRFGDWTGTEPLDLLRQAQKTQTGQAVGRFAKLARDGSASDPLLELHEVSTESLVDQTQQKERLETSKRHGRHVALLQHKVGSDGALVATNNIGGVLVDGSAPQKRSRKRARDEELGNKGDCPVLQRVAWKWTGETSAAAACLLDDITDETPTQKIEFKCGVVMEGSNVFEGLRSLMAAGLTKPTLPDYVRDAPTLGSATITVDHGEFGGTESFAAV